ncbi:MAG: hypothetical protein AAF990_21255 [Bacteroidota bacterium]
MKSITSALCLLALCFFVSCSDDDMDLQEVVDTEGPEVYQSTWVDNPGVDNEPSGPIENGGNYTISIASGFHLVLSIRDISNIVSGSVYFLVNDDPDIRENIIYEGTTFDYDEGSIGFVHRVNSISLGNGVFYDLKVGDTFNFYATFTDAVGNSTEMSWTADLVE